jgi:GTP-binding protein Era
MSTYCGYIAIIGRPNVGKSTLLNALVGKKLSITSRKPQTTRHRILGIKTHNNIQCVFVDTPGIHGAGTKLLNQYMNRTAMAALKDVDLIMWVIEAGRFLTEDENIAVKIKKIKTPFLVIMNKIDKLDQQEKVLREITALSEKLPETEFVPLSAKKAYNLNQLEKIICDKLPEGPFFFDENSLTDRPDSFMCAEMIREKLVRLLGKELPYATTAAIQSIEKKNKILHINSIIWVEKEAQKKIVIGEGGKMLKIIGRQARLTMEKYFEQKIFLTVWVKVKARWTENERLLQKILQ